MARLSEVKVVLRTLGAKEFVLRVCREINEDGVFNMAAAVAYYWLLALFPFVIFIVAVASVMPSAKKEKTLEKIEVWTRANLAPQAAETVVANVQEVVKNPSGGLLSIGLLATLWAASNGMNATMAALDRCYDVTKPRPFLLQRAVAIAITICVVLMMLVVILLIPVTSLVLKLFDARLVEYAPTWATTGTRAVIDVCRYTVGVLLVILIVSSIYQFGISIRRRWTLITPGAIFAVFGVMALAYGFNWYIQSFGGASYAKTYGALGGVIILLLIFYLYAVVFLIGAEINSEIDFAMAGTKNDESTDPLPRVYESEDLKRFREQLERRTTRRH